MEKRKAYFVFATFLLLGLIAGQFAFALAGKDSSWELLKNRAVHKVYVSGETTLLQFDSTLQERRNTNEMSKIGETKSVEMLTATHVVRGVRDVTELFHIDGREISIGRANDIYYEYPVDSGEGLGFHQAGDKGVIVVDNNLYLLDFNENTSSLISKTFIQEFEKNKVLNYIINEPENAHPDDYVRDIYWVKYPKLNDEGTKVIYQSNRRGYWGPYHHDIWMIDLVTGEEYLVVEDALIEDWISNDQFMFQRYTPTYDSFGGIYNTASRSEQTIKVKGNFIVSKHAVVEFYTNYVVIHSWDGIERILRVPNAVSLINPVVNLTGDSLAFLSINFDNQLDFIVIDLKKKEITQTVPSPSREAVGIYFTPNNQVLLTDYHNEVTWMKK